MKDDHPVIRRGEAMANLSTLRTSSVQQSDILQIAIQQFLDEDETLLWGPTQVQASWKMDPNDEGEVTETTTTMLITSHQILVWGESPDLDTRIPAECIELHAMAEDPVSVYLQLEAPDSTDDSWELTVLPVGESSISEEFCQQLFDAVTKLVTLHPIDPNENEQDGIGMAGDDTMIWAPSSSTQDRPATEEERQAMLDHLDRVLVVPPELEQTENPAGQFDDAEDDEDVF